MNRFDLSPTLFEKIVRMYAFQIGRPVHTAEDQEAAFVNYCYIAQTLN